MSSEERQAGPEKAPCTVEMKSRADQQRTSQIPKGNKPTTVYSKRNAHLIPIFFVTPLGEGGQKFTWWIM